MKFVIGDEVIPAHRFVLAIRSEFFKSKLYGGYSDSNTHEMKIAPEDVNIAAFRDMLRYIYTDKVSLCSDNVMDLLHLGKYYLVKDLCDICFEFLRIGMTPDNVCYIMSSAMLFEEKTLVDTSLEFLLENRHAVMKTDPGVSLSVDALTVIVQQENLCLHEIDIFDFCMRWCLSVCGPSSTIEERRSTLGPILPHIRFPTMTIKQLTCVVAKTEILPVEQILLICQCISCDDKIPCGYSTRRRADKGVLLPYLAPEDKKAEGAVLPVHGVLHYIGTEGRARPFVNPHSSRKITIDSSQAFTWGTPDDLASFKAFDRCVGIEAGNNGWVCVDLGGMRRVRLQHYTLRHGNSKGYRMTNWVLEASTDRCVWTELHTVVNNDSWHQFTFGHAFTWTVVEQDKFFRFFRVRITNENPDFAGLYNIMLCGIELYGILIDETVE